MGTEEEKKGQELIKKEEELKAKEKYLDDLQKFFEEKEKKMAEREKTLVSVLETGPAAKKPLSEEDKKLIKEGCTAYGIAEKYLFAAGIDVLTRKAVLVTNGGTKVRYAKGDKVEKLDPVRVDGISRKKPRYVAGKKK